MLVQIIFTRNEGDLLEESIRFHLKSGVDFFLVTDNGSTDKTPDVLKKFEAIGVLKSFLDRRAKPQKECMEAMTKFALNYLNPHWMILSDTDEFWYSKMGLKNILNSIPKEFNVLKVLRYQHFPTAKDDLNELSTHKKILFRETGQHLGIDTGVGDSTNNFARKKIALRSISKNSDIDILPGNHTIHFIGRRVLEVQPDDIVIHEFPFRSYEQFASKVERISRVLLENELYSNNTEYSSHMRKFIDIARNGNLKKYYNENIYFNENRLVTALKSNQITYDSSLLNT